MIVSAIVALSENNVIGVNNQLPWHLPNDLKFFKKTTSHHPIIMGRNTYESIGKALPNRVNIVISRNENYTAPDIRVFPNIESAITFAENLAPEEIFFIGGEQIYKQCIAWCDKLYITRVQMNIENGTAFFPEIDWQQWKLIERVEGVLDEKNIHAHYFEVYERNE